RSRAVVSGLVAITSTLPGRPRACSANASSAVTRWPGAACSMPCNPCSSPFIARLPTLASSCASGAIQAQAPDRHLGPRGGAHHLNARILRQAGPPMNIARTGLLLAALTALFLVVGYLLGGRGGAM